MVRSAFIRVKAADSRGSLEIPLQSLTWPRPRHEDSRGSPRAWTAETHTSPSAPHSWTEFFSTGLKFHMLKQLHNHVFEDKDFFEWPGNIFEWFSGWSERFGDVPQRFKGSDNTFNRLGSRSETKENVKLKERNNKQSKRLPYFGQMAGRPDITWRGWQVLFSNTHSTVFISHTRSHKTVSSHWYFW